MSDLDIAIVKYFENKGFESTARAFRREANCGKGDVESKYTLNDVYTFYRANPSLFPKPAGTETDTSNLNKKRKADEISSSNSSNSAASERVFLGNLSFQVSEESIKKFFASCGEILEVDWVKDKVTGKFYGTAFVTFDSVDTAQKAMAFNGKNFLQRPIKMNFAPHRIPKKVENVRTMPPAPKYYDKPADCRTLFLGNLAFEVTEEAVREFFGKCGPIYEVRFQVRENGDFKGCGFVEFEHESSIADALKLHAKPLMGRPVRLDFA